MYCRARKFSPMTHTELAARLGVTKARLGYVKKTLTAEIHYTQDRPNLYTPAGIAAVEAIFGVQKKEAGPCCDGACACLTVTGSRGRFVTALDSEGAEWQVEVRTPALFARGMTIPATRYTVASARPHFARQKGRSPRSRGRW